MKAAERPILLVLVRHAESMRNQAKKGAVYFADEEARREVKGIPDHKIPLTEYGVRQAKTTGRGLQERFGTPDYVYHSGYARTIQTTDHILSAYSDDEREKIQVRENMLIRERDPGFAYDMTEKEAEEAFPWLKNYWDTFGGFLAHPVGGESLAQVAQRVHLFLDMLFKSRAGQKVFVVTHGGTIRCFRYLLEHWDYERALQWPPGQTPKNCGLTVYEYAESHCTLALREYNTVCWK